MQQTQTININILNATSAPNIPNTPNSPDTALIGLTHWLNTNYLSLILMAAMVILAILATIFFLKYRKNSKRVYRTVSKALLALAIIPSLCLLAQAATYPVANATSTLQLANPTLDITVYKDAVDAANTITKTATTATTVTTDSPAGYTLSAKLDQVSTDGVTASLNDKPLTTSPVDVFASNTSASPSVNDNSLTLNLPSNIPYGTYSLKVIYDVTENQPTPEIACVSGNKFKGSIGDIRNAATTTSTWAIGDTGIATDSRNSQQYCIGKLADNNIWMLNNLKLGSITGTMPLTDQDTNLTTKTSFTLPQLYNGTFGHNSNTVPYAYGPVDDDDSSEAGTTNSNNAINDDTFYGYLYNWTAAIAEDDSSSIANTGTVAPNSICPKGWRLPQGGSIGDPTNDFDILNAKMAGYTDNGTNYQNDFSHYDPTFYNNWLPSGSFRGVFSGYWNSGFVVHGGGGDFWSSSVGSSYNAFGLGFYGGYVYLNDYLYRYYGFGVRCVFSS
jgi:uncharacterized protein (TIGR02145 family)